MSTLHEYLMQAREHDIRRRIRRVSAQSSARGVVCATSHRPTKEHR